MTLNGVIAALKQRKKKKRATKVKNEKAMLSQLNLLCHRFL
jgi:hypothetical protein